MMMTAREFNQYTGRAKLLAREEPVFITGRGNIEYVLLNIEDYRSLAKPQKTLANLFRPDDGLDLDFDFDRYLPERTIDERDLREWWLD
jgi:hypothetical protein